MMEHDSNLRDLAAMFAMLGLIQRIDPEMPADNHIIARGAYDLADALLEARDEPVEGLAAIKKGKRSARKHEDLRSS